MQVKGLQSEYTRMVDSGGVGGAAAGAPSGPAAGGLSAAEVAELRRLVAELEQQNSKLQVCGGMRGRGRGCCAGWRAVVAWMRR